MRGVFTVWLSVQDNAAWLFGIASLFFDKLVKVRGIWGFDKPSPYIFLLRLVLFPLFQQICHIDKRALAKNFPTQDCLSGGRKRAYRVKEWPPGADLGPGGLEIITHSLIVAGNKVMTLRDQMFHYCHSQIVSLVMRWANMFWFTQIHFQTVLKDVKVYSDGNFCLPISISWTNTQTLNIRIGKAKGLPK